VSIANGIHLASNVWTRVRSARNCPEPGSFHAILNELPGAEEFSFASVGAEIMTRDTQGASDSQGAIHSADSRRFCTFDVHLQKIDAPHILPFHQLVQSKPRGLKRTLRGGVHDAIRMPSFEVFDGHGPGGIDERKVCWRHVLEVI